MYWRIAQYALAGWSCQWSSLIQSTSQLCALQVFVHAHNMKAVQSWHSIYIILCMDFGARQRTYSRAFCCHAKLLLHAAIDTFSASITLQKSHCRLSMKGTAPLMPLGSTHILSRVRACARLLMYSFLYSFWLSSSWGRSLWPLKVHHSCITSLGL